MRYNVYCNWTPRRQSNITPKQYIVVTPLCLEEFQPISDINPMLFIQTSLFQKLSKQNNINSQSDN